MCLMNTGVHFHCYYSLMACFAGCELLNRAVIKQDEKGPGKGLRLEC